MRIEMHGHANLLVEGRAGAVLFDPLFYGEHHEGVYDVYPARTFDTNKLGHFQAVIISHAHADHFDLSSVALLPRGIPVLTPVDSEIVSCLRGLGFQQIASLHNFEPVEVGALEIIPTPAAAGAVEHGFVLRDGESTVWNLVDTFPSNATIDQVLERYGPIDLLVAPWQPLHDHAVSTGVGPQFPHGMYSRILTMIARINPRVLVPGACGFWAVGAASWTNGLIFPLTRERFIHDLANLDPTLPERIQLLEPGDSLTVSPRGMSRERDLVACVNREGEYKWQDRAFRPLEMVGRPIVEHRGEGVSIDECGEAISALFEEALPEFLEEQADSFVWHRRWQPVIEYEVHFHGEIRRHWTVHFDGEGVRVEAGQSPLRTAMVGITAGVLIGLIAGTCSWDFAEMSGELRRFEFNYAVDSRGLHVPHSVDLTDPLTMMLGSPSGRELFRTTVVEALDESYREALLAAGLDPAEVLASSIEASRATKIAPVDPTAIAESILKNIQSLSVDSVNQPPYPPAQGSDHEEHDAS